MEFRLRGLHAVVADGSCAIGQAIIRTLALEGCSVAFTHRSAQGLQQLLDALRGLPGAVRGDALDACNAPEMQRWLMDAEAFDIFVPNINASGTAPGVTLVDMRATVNATEAAVPLLQRSAHAALTYVGARAQPLTAPSSARQGAAGTVMAHYMLSLASRLTPSVRVNTVTPGDDAVEATGLDADRRPRGGSWPFHAAARQRVALKGPATPHEIARVVAFVSSPAASFVSGAQWHIDGPAPQRLAA